MRGEKVIVRVFGGRPVVARVWDADEFAVYICDEDNFMRMTEGKEALWPVGFPKEDVFEYDPNSLSGYGLSAWDWKNVKSWTGTVNQPSSATAPAPLS